MRFDWIVLSAALVSANGFGADTEKAPIAGGVTSEALACDECKGDKSGYHLFKPTPRELMRDMSTDRPDKTESAYTVDAGHFQIETDLLAYTYDHRTPDRDGTKTESFNIAPVNFKMGLLNNVDIQFVIETYNIVKTRARNEDSEVFRETQQGFGDITTRVKINAWGNDGGTTALAFMPFVKFPTNQDELGNDAVEAGLIVPLAVELPMGWGMGVMTEVDFLRNDDDRKYHAEFINSITFSHSIVGDLNGYVEFFSAVSSESSSDWVGTVDLGLTYGLTENIQLDAGVNLGVTRAAEDINPFVGLSVRF